MQENNLPKTESIDQTKPLAEQIRPKQLEEIIGQDHITGKNGALFAIQNHDSFPSIILHGPAGIGKTSIAKILAQNSNKNFKLISAIDSNVAELKKIFDARKFQKLNSNNSNQISLLDQAIQKDNNGFILMVDEIHHFNKTQQDLFLPVIESGLVSIIGTTTENPSYHLNSALLSRCKILKLKELDEKDLEKILLRIENYKNQKLPLSNQARRYLVNLSCGDARYLINSTQEIYNFAKNIAQNKILEINDLEKFLSQKSANFDKKGDFHYNLISAFHKSLRGSDVNASLYYLARMLVAKQDPYYILRRLARFATEDIGMADPNALIQVMNAKENYDFLGSPEGDYAISQATIYCACAPKSNSSYLAHKKAIKIANESNHLMPPFYICDSSYIKKSSNNEINKGKERYIYDHDTKNCFSGQEFFPDHIIKNFNEDDYRKLYKPNTRGFEKEIVKRIKYWQSLKNNIEK